MLSNEKWVNYAVRILQAVSQGSESISEIASGIGESESYIAKVVATLRRGKLITSDYMLVKKLDEISIAELLTIADPSPILDPIARYITNTILSGLTLTVRQVLDNAAPKV